MKTLTQVAFMAALLCLLSVASHAAAQSAVGTPAYRFPPMVLPVAGPAVPASVTPGAGPETKSAPMATPASTRGTKGLTNNIQDHFAKARAAYMRTELRLAAAEIRKGAEGLRAEKSRATDEVRKEIAATTIELERLALRVEQRKVTAPGELDMAFARADNVLARHKFELAKAPAPKRFQSAEPSPDISATAAKQGMPERAKEPVSAAYAAPDKRAQESAGPSYKELSRRIDALSRELATLQADLNRLKASETATKN